MEKYSKLTFKNSRELNLVGDLHRSNTENIVIMAHGFTNNRSSQGRFDRIAKALQEDGLSVFAFDFSGCGESDEDILSAKNQEDDLNCAISYMKSLGYKNVLLFANSLGTLISLRCYQADVKAMVLMGALTHSMNYDWNTEFTQNQMNELNNHALITLISEEHGTRLIDKQTLKDFEEIDQKQLLSNVKCPVLIIHGNNKSDEEELELLSHSRYGMKYLSDKSELVVIEGAKHGCYKHIGEVIEMTREWFMNYI